MTNETDADIFVAWSDSGVWGGVRAWGFWLTGGSPRTRVCKLALSGCTEPLRSSNADLAITSAHILGLELPSPMVEFTAGSMRSEVDESSGQVTILKFQDAGGVRYFDTAGFMGRTNGLDN